MPRKLWLSRRQSGLSPEVPIGGTADREDVVRPHVADETGERDLEDLRKAEIRKIRDRHSLLLPVPEESGEWEEPAGDE